MYCSCFHRESAWQDLILGFPRSSTDVGHPFLWRPHTCPAAKLWRRADLGEREGAFFGVVEVVSWNFTCNSFANQELRDFPEAPSRQQIVAISIFWSKHLQEDWSPWTSGFILTWPCTWQPNRNNCVQILYIKSYSNIVDVHQNQIISFYEFNSTIRNLYCILF